MNNEWQLQDAKNKFSEVVNQALSKGPQLITRRGEKTAVLLSYAEYEKLCKAQGKLSEFFRASPLADSSISRDDGKVREGFKL
ncbi:MAG: type II toxin-antitoxin system Phd/YefM family antitoxin [Anaerolineaceae bacterium]|nr:type II toxin-antitoxin system Phd/YefM family antitoxin [Anaerolineaceae bacterium]